VMLLDSSEYLAVSSSKFVHKSWSCFLESASLLSLSFLTQRLVLLLDYAAGIGRRNSHWCSLYMIEV
jgi:hypothetical protein